MLPATSLQALTSELSVTPVQRSETLLHYWADVDLTAANESLTVGAEICSFVMVYNNQ